jgi:hypothetical protein
LKREGLEGKRSERGDLRGGFEVIILFLALSKKHLDFPLPAHIDKASTKREDRPRKFFIVYCS